MSVLAHVLVMIVALLGLIVVTVPLVVHPRVVVPARHADGPFLAAEPQDAGFKAHPSDDASPPLDTLLGITLEALIGLDGLFSSARRTLAGVR